MWHFWSGPLPNASSPEDYEPLDNQPPDSLAPRRKQVHLRRRRVLLVVGSLLLLFVSVGVWLRLFFEGSVGIPRPILSALSRQNRLPPLYSRFHQHELQLSQKDSGKGKPTKYFWIANHMKGNGWGNVMQELLLNSYLAYRADRSFVFNNFTWKDGVSDYTLYNLKPIPTRIPLSVLIRGPTVGEPFIADTQAPHAVMKDFWNEVCPHPTVISNDDVLASMSGVETTAGLIITKWVELLQNTEDRCVEVAVDSFPVFDIWMLQNPRRLINEWPSFSQSPIMTEFGWSTLIELAFDTNREIIYPSTNLTPYLSSLPSNTSNKERYTPLTGLLALHIRRGDFVRHCKRLAGWDGSFMGYNAFPSLPDQLEHPADVPKEEYYRLRCFPEIHEIVRRVEEVRETNAGNGLKNVYIMTNAPKEWILELKAELLRIYDWVNVASSRDLLFNEEQEYVKQAVDMLVGQRAQIFIGNGFSSFTGQINMLRIANDFPSESIRFW